MRGMVSILVIVSMIMASFTTINIGNGENAGMAKAEPTAENASITIPEKFLGYNLTLEGTFFYPEIMPPKHQRFINRMHGLYIPEVNMSIYHEHFKLMHQTMRNVSNEENYAWKNNSYSISMPSIVYVDDDYNSSTPGWQYDHFNKIQDGIDAVAEGGTVYVYNGTYYENVVVNKRINLIGEDRNNTIIDGGMRGDGICISADRVNVSGFTIRTSQKSFYTGVTILSNNNTVYGCSIQDNFDGVFVWFAHNNRIYDCSFSNNIEFDIRLDTFSSNNTVYACNFSSAKGGIYFEWSTHNTIHNCSFLNCGIDLWGSSLSDFLHNISHNTVNGKPLLYYTNSSNITLDGEDAGEIVVVNCSNFDIRNISLNNTTTGIEIVFSNEVKIHNCNISWSYSGLAYYHSNGEIYNCNISCNDYGMSIYHSNGEIYNCNIFSSNFDGIGILVSSSYTVYNCTFRYNKRFGVWIGYSPHVKLKNNTFFQDGVFINGLNYKDHIQDIDTSNKVDGKPIYYFLNQTVDINGLDAGQIILVNCTGRVQNVNISHTDVGINIIFSSNITVGNCKLYENDGYGLRIAHSNYITVKNNRFDNNRLVGLVLILNSSYNIIMNNNISLAQYSGIYVGHGGYPIEYSGGWNKITGNNLFKNGIGMEFRSNNNLVYHNNFIDNIEQANDSGNNMWYNETLQEGNYWSDFDEPSEGAYDNDSNGIIDSPYHIPGGNNTDKYPLLHPYGINLPPSTSCQIVGKKGNNGWYISHVDVVLHAVDEDGSVNATYYRINGGGWKKYNGMIEIMDEGIFILQYYSIDDEGLAENVKEETIKIDLSKPTTECILHGTLGKNNWYIGKVEVEFNVQAGPSGVAYTMYRLDGGKWNTYITPFTVRKEGEHLLEYYSVDAAGHVEDVKSTIFRIDIHSPHVRVIYPNGGEEVAKMVTIRWVANDSVDRDLDINIYYSNDGTNWSVVARNIANTGNYDWNISNIEPGDYWIKVTAIDDAGHMGSDTSDGTFTILPNASIAIKIAKPGNFLYIMDRAIMRMPMPIIIGKITLKVEAKSNMQKVEFYVDGVLKASITQQPYSWQWNEFAFGKHEIMVIAYHNGIKTVIKENVWVINL